MNWPRLKEKLIQMKINHEPIMTPIRKYRNHIEEVGDNYVILRSERTNITRKLTVSQIENGGDPHRHIKEILKALADANCLQNP